jgi:hypothetical protein
MWPDTRTKKNENANPMYEDDDDDDNVGAVSRRNLNM